MNVVSELLLVLVLVLVLVLLVWNRKSLLSVISLRKKQFFFFFSLFFYTIFVKHLY